MASVYAGDGTQGEGADDRINAVVWQRDSFAGQIQEFDIQFCLATLVDGSLHHTWIGFECIDFADFSGIVVREVRWLGRLALPHPSECGAFPSL
jgi:hypothetical protein